MSVPTLHEDDVEALGLPGRQLSWLVAASGLQSRQLLGLHDSRRPG